MLKCVVVVVLVGHSIYLLARGSTHPTKVNAITTVRRIKVAGMIQEERCEMQKPYALCMVKNISRKPRPREDMHNSILQILYLTMCTHTYYFKGILLQRGMHYSLSSTLACYRLSFFPLHLSYRFLCLA